MGCVQCKESACCPSTNNKKAAPKSKKTRPRAFKFSKKHIQRSALRPRTHAHHDRFLGYYEEDEADKRIVLISAKQLSELVHAEKKL
jgi:hypothetical protein